MEQERIIGVIGGMGPYAGLDLVRKIFDHTAASRDQDHLPVALLSYPGRIRDRSLFLLRATGEDSGVNPAEAIAGIALELDRLGATVAGIPCNTAHAPAIFDVVQQRLREAGASVQLLNMIDEAVNHIRAQTDRLERIGLLSTSAVYRFGSSKNALQDAGLTPILPDETAQENLVSRTIFEPSYGIKAQANPVSQIARQSLLSAIHHLKERGAEAVVLGCTELPLAVPEREIEGLPLIDPTEVLARALIRATYPDRLKE